MRKAVPEAFVWEIMIEPSYIGEGYGWQAMMALEEEVQALGISRISLKVFAHNIPAQNLYVSLGYKKISNQMLKCL